MKNRTPNSHREFRIMRDACPVGSPEWHAIHNAWKAFEEANRVKRRVSQRRHADPVVNDYAATQN